MPAKRKAVTLGLFDFMQRYPTRQSAIDYLERIRLDALFRGLADKTITYRELAA